MTDSFHLAEFLQIFCDFSLLEVTERGEGLWLGCAVPSAK